MSSNASNGKLFEISFEIDKAIIVYLLFKMNVSE